MNCFVRRLVYNQRTILKNNAFEKITFSSSKPNIVNSASNHLNQGMSGQLIANHNTEECEFFIKLAKDDTAKAVLEYSWIDNATIDMYHTGVPEEFRGKGVAKILAKTALDFAVEKDLKCYLTCTYLQKYVKDNPLEQYTQRVLGP